MNAIETIFVSPVDPRDVDAVLRVALRALMHSSPNTDISYRWKEVSWTTMRTHAIDTVVASIDARHPSGRASVTRPALPVDLVAAIQAYGDACASQDGSDARKLKNALELIQSFAVASSTPPPVHRPELDALLFDLLKETDADTKRLPPGIRQYGLRVWEAATRHAGQSTTAKGAL